MEFSSLPPLTIWSPISNDNEQFKRLRSQQGLLITGPPGSGKSTMVLYMAQRLRPQAHIVLWGDEAKCSIEKLTTIWGEQLDIPRQQLPEYLRRRTVIIAMTNVNNINTLERLLTLCQDDVKFVVEWTPQTSPILPRVISYELLPLTEDDSMKLICTRLHQAGVTKVPNLQEQVNSCEGCPQRLVDLAEKLIEEHRPDNIEEETSGVVSVAADGDSSEDKGKEKV